ncbi:MAG: GTP-binding protein, partial [Terriglobales bacterium]
IPGTTRDAVDEIVERDGHVYRFIDTAGIRRKGKTKLMAEKLSVVMARKHLESADVALLMIDAVEGVTALDANIAGYAHESGRSLIVVVNKWDLVAGPNVTRPRSSERTPGGRIRPGEDEPASPHDYEHRLRYKLKFLAYAPVLFISATSGKNVEKVFATVELVAAERSKRISTSEINRFLATVDFERAGVPRAKKVRIYYMTQAATSPPTFVLFTDKAVKLHFSYQRFLENQIRRAFGFTGTPIWIKNRAKR